MESIAFLGTGRMGAPMAANLAKAGFDVIVVNRTAQKARALADQIGARVASSPAEAMGQASLAIAMLADASALREVVLGAEGVLAGAKPGDVVVDMGTTGLEGFEVVGEVAKEHQVDLIDAPVSGSTAAAESGRLAIMVGASESSFRRVEEPLRSMGDRVFHVGGPGAGMALKLAINSAIFNIMQATAEVLSLAQSYGVDIATTYDVLESSAAAAPVVLYRRQQFLDPSAAPVTFTLDLTSKDLGLIESLAHRQGLRMPLTMLTAALVEQAIDAGLGDRDIAALALMNRLPEVPSQSSPS